ncbi:MAG TPA: PH domain-containing protein, partial [Myxococcota bacterium]|nr:PH domain-containing protein [Myxococcota bacterium]
EVRADAQAMTGSMRLFGNGGLFSFTGLFQSRTLGRYRAFVTDPARAVVLRTARRVVIVSPAEPQAFVEAARAFA